MPENTLASDSDGMALGAHEYGGFRRLTYVVVLILLQLVLILADYFGLPSGFGMSMSASMVSICYLLTMIYVTAERYRNQGSSQLWGFGLLIPFFNMYVFARALGYPEGYMRSRRLDLPGKMVFVVFVLFVFSLLAAITIPAYQDYIQAAENARAMPRS